MDIYEIKRSQQHLLLTTENNKLVAPNFACCCVAGQGHRYAKLVVDKIFRASIGGALLTFLRHLSRPPF